jgi:hypothetical protein
LRPAFLAWGFVYLLFIAKISQKLSFRMKQVFLHIGTHKTGTTSLQFFLHKNRKHLIKLGYLYPTQSQAHQNLAFTLMDDPRANYQKDTWEEVINEIESKNTNKIIISSEAFLESGKQEFIEQVAAKLEKYQTKIIIYLKRQDKKIESNYNQNLKTGVFIGSPEQYVEKTGMPNYLRIINNWNQCFGKENIIVRPLEKQQIPNIYTDFLKTVGIDSIEGFQRSEDLNIKPNLAQIIALSFINQKMATRLGFTEYGLHRLDLKSDRLFLEKYPQSFLNYTNHWQSKPKYNLISYPTAKLILEKSEKQDTRIAKQFLNRPDGKLFYEPLEPYEHDPLDFNNLSKEQLMDLCSYMCNFAKITI